MDGLHGASTIHGITAMDGDIPTMDITVGDTHIMVGITHTTDGTMTGTIRLTAEDLVSGETTLLHAPVAATTGMEAPTLPEQEATASLHEEKVLPPAHRQGVVLADNAIHRQQVTVTTLSRQDEEMLLPSTAIADAVAQAIQTSAQSTADVEV